MQKLKHEKQGETYNFLELFIFFKQIDLCLVFFLQNDKTNLFHNNYLTTMVQAGYVIINIMILIFCVIIKIYEILMFSDDGKD